MAGRGRQPENGGGLPVAKLSLEFIEIHVKESRERKLEEKDTREIHASSHRTDDVSMMLAAGGDDFLFQHAGLKTGLRRESLRTKRDYEQGRKRKRGWHSDAQGSTCICIVHAAG